MIHELKILPQYFKEVVNGREIFEVRKNDRNFKKGDLLILQEFDGREYTGLETRKEITYVLDDSRYLQDEYVVLGMGFIGEIDLNNIYCENSKCKNYFEDMCMLERIEINVEGKNELYELENEYTIHVKDLNSVEVTCITSGITVKSNSSNSILRLELEDLN
ncbi:DUF3850 domain-containing protein [Clostridioides difficile]|uniref:DUF3850 domain-containing protein n=1 Tax=Clostridioides difficile TaxID=1496 RepID=UPI00038CAE81|nr:DUF3850 domain-containing protein [Clostridioides difficile]EQJ20235.1 hypothetical protein QS3_0252 [Clostridioides difficile P13]MCE0686336.1 DUF3850 domain-containing protein [Clostridioides difficile]MCE4815767.1 DUF3850 domain-containing protein [Clostridioides difficile]MCG7710453.1 DUF3850 domain-containing protein [Clostridioides difficile]MCH7253679.1 DUF3850 domain-containing protein [Clostridioides difficile]